MQGILKNSSVVKISLLTAAVVAAALIGAYAVFGGLTSSEIVKLNPTSLSVASGSAWVEDGAAWSLSDRDTSTVYAPSATVTNVLVTLPAETDLSFIKIYGSASFTLKVYEDSTGAWKLISGLDAISLKSQSEAWNTFKPSGTARVSRVMIEITKASGSQTGIKEIEIWGADSGDPRLTLDAVKTASEARTILAATVRPAHIMELAGTPSTIDVPADGSLYSETFSLSAAPRLVKRAYLLYDSYNADYPVSPEKRINNLSWTGGFVPSSSAVPQWVSHLEEISPSWLVKGVNKIEFRNQVTGRDPSSYFRGSKCRRVRTAGT